MKCIKCGGALRYDPASYGLKCDYCGFVKQLPRPEEQAVIEERDFGTAVRDANYNWGVMRRIVNCGDCGAVTLYDPDQISGVCPYCGSPKVLTTEETNCGVAPDGVIPFSISKEEVIQKYYKWNKWALWSPEKFRKGKFLGNLTGVYIPYWTFDADTVSTYSGEFGYTTYEKDSSNTKYYNRSGMIKTFINDYSICGSRTFINDKLFKSVIGFGPDDIIPYTPEALMGFAAEKYSIGIDEAWDRSKEGIRKRLENEACKDQRADTYSKLQISTEYSNIKFKYILVPVWLTACRYKGKAYNVVASGHNGRGNCRRPVSAAKIIGLILIVMSIPTLTFFLSLLVTFIMHLFTK